MGRIAYIALGSNLGDRAWTVMQALKALDDAEGVSVRKISQMAETEPVGGPAGQAKFINAAAEIETTLEPLELLAVLQQVERGLGRRRDHEQRWGPRTCDLDILLMGETVIESDALTIPHPRMHERPFVLRPLVEIAAEVVHPLLGRTIAQLLAEAAQQPAAGRQRVTEEPQAIAPLISIIGPPASGKTTLAEAVAEDIPARLIREDYAGNPFLSDSYLRGGEFALPSQLYFLFSRLSQLNLQTWPAGGIFVTDYGFCQDAVYAGINLSAEDLALYRRLATGSEQRVKPPDVLVQLDGPEELLLERIARRGRPHERVFTAEFLGSMRRAYWKITAEAAVPVVTVDVQQADLLARQGRAEVLKAVREALR